ncbi:TIGR03758 family integrating conjugative element protein [Pseudomonas lopnurensis]|uniref:TIGR03758 family integrating conjugative element protein n=1 Tax=Pseudomonas lopnurensis TaxID=1477517 RepID=UPI0028ABD7A8|nr:TIGR03758 family integrating conjugative element protein [Pseudomonas lopnurensis]
MTPEQTAAFEVGAGYQADQAALLISLVGAAVLFLFLAWVIFSAYRAWADRSLSLQQLGIAVLRSALLMSVLLLIFAL